MWQSNFCSGRGSYVLRGCIRYSRIYIVRMSPAPSRNSALQRIKLGDALEIHDGIIFGFYSGLPHIYVVHFCLYTSSKITAPQDAHAAGLPWLKHFRVQCYT